MSGNYKAPFVPISPNIHNECDTSEDIGSDFEDDDTCATEDLNRLFKYKYKIHDINTVTYDGSYILSLAKDDSFQCIAAGLSDGSVRLFEINTEKGLYIKPPVVSNELSICGVRFADETPNLLLVGTTNGLVRLLDLRTRNEVLRLVYKPHEKLDPRDILSFDRNSNSRLIALGSEGRSNNMFLLFYDLRTSNRLFTYCESHQDDITSLRFHPHNPNILCSGSTDGLINIFDVVAKDEDHAILTTINTESSVHKVNWHSNSNGEHIVSCITHTNDFKAYTFDGDMIADFDRLKLCETIKRKNEANCNLIDCHSTVDNCMMLLTGSNFKNGSVLRSCKLQNTQLLPFANFEGNAQIIRESIFDFKTNILITGGENGFVTLWTPDTNSYTTCTNFKMKTKKTNKVAPY